MSSHDRRKQAHRARGGPAAAAALAVLFVVFLLSPVLALALPGTWSRHVYHELSFQVIARNELPASAPVRELIRAAVAYNRRHIWLFDDSVPYDGRTFDYLVEGVGWCDYHAKVFCKLLAARGIHARYAFLRDKDGVSPHTVAEVYEGGQWRAIDPFFNVQYRNAAGAWATLEEVTPEAISRLPDVALLKKINPALHGNIMWLAGRTYPLPLPPQRSDDFLAEKHIFDHLVGVYARVLGTRFSHWYQDAYLARALARVSDPAARTWYRARHLHLYARLHEAEPLYRVLLADPSAARLHERATLFLGQLLLRQGRPAEAAAVLEDARFTARPWAQYHLALCDEALGQPARAMTHYQAYQRLSGKKFAVEAAARLNELQAQRLNSTRPVRGTAGQIPANTMAVIP